MDVKNWLMKVQEMEEQIDEQELFIFELRNTLYGTGSTDYSKEKVQSSPRNRMEELISKLVDEEARLEWMRQNLIIFKCDVIIKIHEMDNTRYKQILMLKYIDWRNHPNLAAVGMDINYSDRHTRRLHGEAIRELEKILSAECPLHVT